MTTSDMKRTIETPVLIVGAGPVGMGLAIDLAWRGHASLIIEQEPVSTGDIVLAKATGINSRSMELLRRWGISQRMASVGALRDVPRTTFYCTALNGKVLGSEPRPSTTNLPLPSYSPERPSSLPQYLADPVLIDALGKTGLAETLYRHRFVSLEQNDRGVTAQVVNLETGEEVVIRSRYLVGCDGAGSSVRRHLGIQFPGPKLGESVSAMVRIPDFFSHAKVGRGVRYMFIDTGGTWANFLGMDGQDVWRFVLMGQEDKPDPTAEEMAALVRRAVGRDDLVVEILDMGRWRRTQCAAESYRSARVMLAGDSAHSMSPTGGHGLNTGYGDVLSLGWMLDANLRGWAGERLLDAYGTERRPVSVRNGSISSANFSNWIGATDFSRVFDESSGGDAERARIGQAMSAALQKEWFAVGVGMGYRYEGSPIVVPDGSPEPPDEIGTYEQTARPGHRAPHAWLSDGRSIIDLFGKAFVLLRFGSPPVAAGDLPAAARQRGVPLEVVDIDQAEIAALYEYRLALVRPDGQVAWRGNATPDDPVGLIDIVRGA